jgi:hypothetical protein
MRVLALRMSLHEANPAAAFNQKHILTLNYRLINTSAEGVGFLGEPEINATTLARLRAAAASWTQRIPIHGHQTLIVYRTNWAVAAVAAAVGVAGVLAVLPLDFGWWRVPSLNPLETVVAMGAPLLHQRPAPGEGHEGGDDDEWQWPQRRTTTATATTTATTAPSELKRKSFAYRGSGGRAAHTVLRRACSRRGGRGKE